MPAASPTPLAAALRRRIEARGPIPFADFMRAALYDPDHGYYATGRPWRGEGDFVTAPRFGGAFARALARWLVRARAAMGPGPFEAVEVGAGSGALAAQLAPRLAAEGMPLRAVEVRRPPQLPPEVPWSPTNEGQRVRGAQQSNELFDALPVDVVEGTAAGPRAWWVAARGGALALQRGPVPPESLAYLQRFGMVPGEGEVVEACPAALAQLRALAAALEEGVVLTVDYGDEAAALRARPGGTLAAVRAHRLQPDPLADPGLQDLTAHVNFTALVEEGRALGLEPLALRPQWDFLARAGALEDIARGLQGPDFAAALAAKTLVAPGRMGDFKVLLQGKGLAAEAAQALAR